jgi:hypothetical protein
MKQRSNLQVSNWEAKLSYGGKEKLRMISIKMVKQSLPGMILSLL